MYTTTQSIDNKQLFISQFYQIHQYNVRIVQFEIALAMTSDSPGNHKGLAMPLLEASNLCHHQ